MDSLVTVCILRLTDESTITRGDCTYKRLASEILELEHFVSRQKGAFRIEREGLGACPICRFLHGPIRYAVPTDITTIVATLVRAFVLTYELTPPYYILYYSLTHCLASSLCYIVDEPDRKAFFDQMFKVWEIFI